MRYKWFYWTGVGVLLIIGLTELVRLILYTWSHCLHANVC